MTGQNRVKNGMMQLMKESYESYILLDKKVVMTPKRSGLVRRTLSRKVDLGCL